MSRETNAAGVDLIKRNEKLVLHAYLCPAGIPTIGYGHTGDVKLGQTITEHQADVLLRYDLGVAERTVEAVGVPLNDNEFAALVSLTFNIGAKAFETSTLRRKLANGHPRAEVAAEFGKWIHGGGQVLPGLVKRRAEEAALFLRAP